MRVDVSGATSTANYNHQDGLGSVIAVSDSTGHVTGKYGYGPYGESSSLSGNPYRFTGRRLDPETGLYYYRSRYYSAALGRFMQNDTIGYDGGINLYAYVMNDPVNAVDPSGTDAILVSYPSYEVRWKGLELPLGHAGVVGVNSSDGSATYYEFGLYAGATYGKVNTINYPAGTITYDRSGSMTAESVVALMQSLSQSSGQGSDIITQINNTDYRDVAKYAEAQQADVFSDSPNHPYSIFTNNCFTFATNAYDAGPTASVTIGGGLIPGPNTGSQILSDMKK